MDNKIFQYNPNSKILLKKNILKKNRIPSCSSNDINFYKNENFGPFFEVVIIVINFIIFIIGSKKANKPIFVFSI